MKFAKKGLSFLLLTTMTIPGVLLPVAEIGFADDLEDVNQLYEQENKYNGNIKLIENEEKTNNKFKNVNENVLSSVYIPNNWSDVQAKIDSGETEINISSLLDDANKTVLTIDNKTVKIIGGSKEFKNLQIRLKNNGNLELENMIINNRDLHINNMGLIFSPVYVEDTTDNKLVLSGENKISSEGKSAAISVSKNKDINSKLTIIGSGKLDVSIGTYDTGTSAYYTGAAIGGEYNHGSGEINILDNVELNVISAHRSAGIGGGQDQNETDNGNITIGEDAKVNVLNYKDNPNGASIGGGSSYGQNTKGSSGDIVIKDRAKIYINRKPDNAAAIGQSSNNKQGHILIKDNVEINLDNVHNGIGGASQSFNDPDTDDYLVRITGQPKIKIKAIIGISAKNGNILIDGVDKDNFDIDFMTHGIAIYNGDLNIINNTNETWNMNLKMIFEDEVGYNPGAAINGEGVAKINIKGKDKNIIINGHTDLGAIVGTYSGSTYINHGATPDSISQMGIIDVNIDNAVIQGVAERGPVVGIGYSDLSNMKININNSKIERLPNSSVDIGDRKNSEGAIVGTGGYVTNRDYDTGKDAIVKDPYILGGKETPLKEIREFKVDIINSEIKGEVNKAAAIGLGNQADINSEFNIINSDLDIKSQGGAGIGTGQFSGYDKFIPLNFILKIEETKGKIESLNGAGIGTGYGSILEKLANINIKNSNLDIKSMWGAGIGGGRLAITEKDGQITKEYIPSGANTTIDGGKIVAKSVMGSGIGGGGSSSSYGYDDLHRTIDIEGSLKVLNNADIIATSRGLDKGVLARDAITAKLIDGSDKTMISHTFVKEVPNTIPFKILVKDLSNNTIREIQLEEEWEELKTYPKSYAYTTNNSAEIYKEDAYYTKDNKDYIGEIYQAEPLRESGRHEANTKEFKSVTSYKGKEQNIINDNTFVVFDEKTIEDEHTVKFETNGGNNIENQIVKDKEKAKEPKAPIKDGYEFVGWYENEGFSGDKFEFDTEITEDITLYAKWKKIEKPTEPTNPTKPTDPTDPTDPTETVDIDTVILANGKKYTDVLTATVLGSEKKAPILLSTVNEVDSKTKAEIKRLNPKEIIISGGENSVSEKIKIKLEKEGYKVRRISGIDRYKTAEEIAKEVRALTGVKDEVMLVDGTNFPDVITLSPYASNKHTPILLTEPNSLNDITKKALKEFEIEEITIGGEKNSVSKEIEKFLKTDYKVSRIGGADRYVTASLIAKEVRKQTGNKDDLILVDGTDFPDGITISSLANKYQSPIHLTNPKELTKVTSKDIKEFGIKNITIGGGENSVSKAIENELKAQEIVTNRIAGIDRYVTAVEISKEFTK